ncbi:MAG TPA: BlaI/MecI/CopY family transcriptional regulator [Bryobacteraceae bacterium]|nr:BlaI/MecI/CopY family transcriptional regulator [Bryobacteraceae bacterium]
MASKPPCDRRELAILRVLWDGGPATLRETLRTLNQAKPRGYTAALRLLQIMTEMGIVERDEPVRPQVYRPSCPRGQTQRQLVRDLPHGAFGGSVRTLVLHALAEEKSSTEELAEIESCLIDSKEVRNDRSRSGA